MSTNNCIAESTLQSAILRPFSFARSRILTLSFLAGLLTNSAFWVVNHKANKGPFLENLSTFDEIISYKKGTTSFGIASRIFHDPTKAAAIRTVNPKEELNLLVDSSPNTNCLVAGHLRYPEIA